METDGVHNILNVHTLNKNSELASMKLPSNIQLVPLDFVE